MKTQKCVTFEISPSELDRLKALYPKEGKSADVGRFAEAVAKLYLSSIKPGVEFQKGTDGADLKMIYDGIVEQYEIKGTSDSKIAWSKLKVSSQRCYESLKNGLTLLRVTNIGKPVMKLYFLKFGEDFDLVVEARWAVVPRKPLDLPHLL